MARRMRWAAGVGKGKEAGNNGDGKEDEARQLFRPWTIMRRIPRWDWKQQQQEAYQQMPR